MTISFDSVATLPEQELLDYFNVLVDRDRRNSAALLVAISEIDERKIWAKHGCSSMFTFCMERFHMSAQVTAKRIWSARTARRFPVILPMVASGELHLGAIHLLAGHLTEENHALVLDRAKHKSSREVEQLIAELSPRADVPSRIRAMPVRRMGAHAGGTTVAGSSEAASTANDAADRDQAVSVTDRQHSFEVVGRASDRSRTSESGTVAKPIVPLSPRRYKIEITVDEATHDKLRSLQDLLGRSEAGRDPAAIISRAIDVLLDRTLARKAGCTDRPKPAKAQCTASPGVATQRGPQTRTIPAAVRREVWRRDCGRCCYVDPSGRRCAATSNVEFHHRTPFATGGTHTPENIELRCAAHNQYQADLDFGRSFMNGRRRTGATSLDGTRGRTGPTSVDDRRGRTAPTSNGGRHASTDGRCGTTAPASMDSRRRETGPTFPGECSQSTATL